MIISCPVCQNQVGNSLEDTVLHVYRCASCGHMYTHIPSEQQETYRDNYFLEAHKNWFEHPHFALFISIINEINKNFGDKPISLLDVGCGNGDFLRFFYQHRTQADCYGIDIAKNDDPHLNFIQGDFLSHTFGKQFDVLVALMVIEHIDNPIEFVKKMAATMLPASLVIIVTINNNSLIYRLARFMKWFGARGPYERLYEHHHLQHYTNQSLRQLMQMNGFQVVAQRNHNFPLAAIDLPSSSAFKRVVYRIGIACLFAVTAVVGGGIDQTIICQKK